MDRGESYVQNHAELFVVVLNFMYLAFLFFCQAVSYIILLSLVEKKEEKRSRKWEVGNRKLEVGSRK